MFNHKAFVILQNFESYYDVQLAR